MRGIHFMKNSFVIIGTLMFLLFSNSMVAQEDAYVSARYGYRNDVSVTNPTDCCGDNNYSLRCWPKTSDLTYTYLFNDVIVDFKKLCENKNSMNPLSCTCTKKDEKGKIIDEITKKCPIISTKYTYLFKYKLAIKPDNPDDDESSPVHDEKRNIISCSNIPAIPGPEQHIVADDDICYGFRLDLPQGARARCGDGCYHLWCPDMANEEFYYYACKFKNKKDDFYNELTKNKKTFKFNEPFWSLLPKLRVDKSKYNEIDIHFIKEKVLKEKFDDECKLQLLQNNEVHKIKFSQTIYEFEGKEALLESSQK